MTIEASHLHNFDIIVGTRDDTGGYDAHGEEESEKTSHRGEHSFKL